MKLKNPLTLEGARPLSEKAIDALEHLDASRRDFLKTAGVMIIGFGAAATGKAQSTSGNVDNAQLDSWVAIGGDESITVFAGKCDFGQGMLIAPPMPQERFLELLLQRVNKARTQTDAAGEAPGAIDRVA